MLRRLGLCTLGVLKSYFSAPKRKNLVFSFSFSAPPRYCVRRPINFFDPPKMFFGSNFFFRPPIFFSAPQFFSAVCNESRSPTYGLRPSALLHVCSCSRTAVVRVCRCLSLSSRLRVFARGTVKCARRAPSDENTPLTSYLFKY